MEWLLVVLVAGAGGLATKRGRDRKAVRRAQQEGLDGVKRLADEDVTLLGEQLQRLDRDVAGHDLDEDTRIAYQTALDSYESAQQAVPRIRSAQEISKLTDTLSAGRYALACVQARVAGKPLPGDRGPTGDTQPPRSLVGGPVRVGVRPGQSRRQAASGESGALLLQSAAPPVG